MKSIEIISIPVTDQERAKEFYLNLGFEIITEAPMGKDKWIQMALPGNAVSVTLVNWFPKMSAGSFQGMVVLTDSIDKDRQELKLKGIEVGVTDETPWGKFANIVDPDGNGLTLREE